MLAVENQYFEQSNSDIIDEEHEYIRTFQIGSIVDVKKKLKELGVNVLNYRASSSRWSILHYACFAGNLEVVSLLLDKSKLDDDIFYPEKVSEDCYISFVNARSSIGTSAIGRAMIALTNRELNVSKQICLFLSCKFFKVNDLEYLVRGNIIHYLIRNNHYDLLKFASLRQDIEWDMEDLTGLTPLEIAVQNDDNESIEILADISDQLDNPINPTRIGHVSEVLEIFSNYFEESRFGENSVIFLDQNKKQLLTASTLLDLYLNPKNPEGSDRGLAVWVEYNKTKLHLEYKFGTLEASLQDKWIKVLSYFAEYYENPDVASIIEIPSDIVKDSKTIGDIDFAEVFYSDEWSGNDSITLTYNGVDIEIRKIGQEVETVLEQGLITYDTLALDEEIDYLQNPEQKEEILSWQFVALPYIVATKCSVQCVQALLKFRNFDFNIITSFNGKLVSLQDALEESRKDIYLLAKKRNVSVSEDYENSVHTMSNELQQVQAENPGDDDFRSILTQRIIETNARIYVAAEDRTSRINRRFDALARLLEPGCTCAAVCFDGTEILIAFNENFNATNTKAIFTHFKNVIDSSKPELINSGRHKILLQQAKIAYGKVTEEIVSILSELVCALELGLRDPALTFKDSEQILEKTKLESVLNGIDNGKTYEYFSQRLYPAKSSKDESSSEQRFNILVSKILRYMKDVKKIEFSLIHREFSPEFIKAIFDQKIKVISYNDDAYLSSANDDKSKDGVHAEMKLVNYLLKSRQSKNSPLGELYLGISKLSCACCNFIVSYLNDLTTFSGKFVELSIRGLHGVGFKWPVPEFLKNPTIVREIFAFDQELLKSYLAREEYQPGSTVSVFQEPEKSFQKNVRVLVAPWSESKPTITYNKKFTEEEQSRRAECDRKGVASKSLD